MAETRSAFIYSDCSINAVFYDIQTARVSLQLIHLQEQLDWLAGVPVNDMWTEVRTSCEKCEVLSCLFLFV